MHFPDRASPPLAQLTTLGVGGPADHYVEAHSESDVVSALAFAKERGLRVYPLGGGSNLVVADSGVRGLVLHVKTRGIEVERRAGGASVTAQAGEPWDAFTERCCLEDWAGVECLGGIPGAVGATPIQNVGAYGQEVADTVRRVRVVDRATLEVSELSHAECAFSYRDSFFKREGAGRFVVLSVTYELTTERSARPFYPELARALEGRGTVDSRTIRDTVIALRRQKSMVLDANDENGRSCGSFFVNAELTGSELARVRAESGAEPPAFLQKNGLFKVPSAWLIERAGLKKGQTLGPCGLSSKHTLSIVAHPGAKASDVVRFAAFVRETVRRKFDVDLVPEPHFWGFGAVAQGLPVEPEA